LAHGTGAGHFSNMEEAGHAQTEFAEQVPDLARQFESPPQQHCDPDGQSVCTLHETGAGTGAGDGDGATQVTVDATAGHFS